jgi:hypothetical protein
VSADTLDPFDCAVVVSPNAVAGLIIVSWLLEYLVELAVTPIASALLDDVT